MKISKSNRLRWIGGLAVFFALPVILFYVWLISVGLWTRWPATTNYYDQLASAFQHGQLYLEQQPDPRLSQLSNPYDPEIRSGISTPLDISFYNGKFYLYWGRCQPLSYCIWIVRLSSRKLAIWQRPYWLNMEPVILRYWMYFLGKPNRKADCRLNFPVRWKRYETRKKMFLTNRRIRFIPLVMDCPTEKD